MKRVPLLRRKRLRPKPRRDDDKVTPEVYSEVIERDNFTCTAPLLDAGAGECRDQWGEPFSGQYVVGAMRGPLNMYLTLDHVNDRSTLGKRAPSDPAHLLTICWWHGVIGPWNTTHRQLQREHLSTLYPP